MLYATNSAWTEKLKKKSECHLLQILPGILTFFTGLIQLKTNWWYFSYFLQRTGFDISYKLSPMETICMKCQNLFSAKKKKFKMSAENFTQSAKF